MSDEKIAAVVTAIENLRSKGVTGIKIELEAQMGRAYPNANARRNTDSGATRHVACNECDEDGEVQCSYCEGSGEHQCELTDCPNNGETCDDCEGTGYRRCSVCSGEGSIEEPVPPTIELARESTYEDGEWDNDRFCLKWLMEKVAQKTGEKRKRIGSYEASDPLPWIRYARFYNDGSVDSELTFTVPIDNAENVKKIVHVLEAFREMGDAINSGFRVDGAGMHMAVIFSDDCSYPHQEDDYTRVDDPRSHRLPETTLRNFRRSMTQLLPALFFLASPNEKSRALRYRMPTVSIDARYGDYLGSGTKYSAITYRLGAFEFRVFDTCYDNPETVFDNIVVIANCMQFLTPKFKSPGVDKLIKELDFGTDQNDRLDRFFMTEKHIDVLDQGLRAIKPSYYSIRELKRQRNFTLNKSEVGKLVSEQERKANAAYEEYKERERMSLITSETAIKVELITKLLAELPLPQLQSMTSDEIEEAIAVELKQRLAQLKSTRVTKARYVKQIMDNFNQTRVGRFKLTFS